MFSNGQKSTVNSILKTESKIPVASTMHISTGDKMGETMQMMSRSGEGSIESLQMNKMSASSGGLKMPEKIQAKMEHSFGSDFSNVNIHANSQMSTDIGALAYTQGSDIHFAPGQYDPTSTKGQELLGHELTHVVQQRQGRVQPTLQAKGVSINDEPSLEKEADVMGMKAAQMKASDSHNYSAKEQTLENSNIQQKSVVQCFRLSEEQALAYPRLTQYLRYVVQEISNNETIVGALLEFGQLTPEQINDGLAWDSGPMINVTDLVDANGEFTPNSGSDELRIDSDIVEQLESAVGADRDPALLLVASTILHEYTHFGDDQDGVDYTEGHGEEGQALEEAIYGRDIDNIDDARAVLDAYRRRHGR